MATQTLVNFPVVTNFRLYIPECPLLSELAQDVTIPAITLNPAEVFTRTGDYGQPGEKLVFTELDIGFAMDEYYDVYAEVYSWMNRMAGMPELQSVEERDRYVLFCDIELTLLDNKQKMARKFIFHDAWPTALGAIGYDGAGQAENVRGLVTFEYIAMEIKPDTKNLTNIVNVEYNH